MSFKGFLVARTKNSEEFFNSATSYDRAGWSSLKEATIYPSVEAAEAAAKKLWAYGSYQAKVVSEAQLDMTNDKSEWPIKNMASWRETVNTKHPRATIKVEGPHRYVASAKNKVVGKFDNQLANCGYVAEAMQFEFPNGETVNTDDKKEDNRPHNAYPKDEMVAKVQDDNPSQVEQNTSDDEDENMNVVKEPLTVALSQGQENEEITVSRIRFQNGQKVKEQNGKTKQVVSDPGTGVAVISKVGDVNGKTNVRADDTKLTPVGENAELPAKPPLDIPTQATVTKYPKTTTLKFDDPYQKKDEPTGDNLSDMSNKIKVPNDVASDLADAISTFQKAYDYSNGRDDDRASFCLTTLDCLKQLQADIQAGTVDNIKQAQINITSWMNPIVNNVPTSVRKFIYNGGKSPSLKDLFDVKRQEKKEVTESVNHMGEKEYQTYAGWKRAVKAAHPTCTFRGDIDIGAAVVDGKDVGEWDGAVGCIFKSQAKAK